MIKTNTMKMPIFHHRIASLIPISAAFTYVHITFCRFISSSNLLEKGPVAIDGFCCSGHETYDGRSRPRQGWNGRTTVCRRSRVPPARKVKNNSVSFSRKLFIVARRVAKAYIIRINFNNRDFHITIASKSSPSHNENPSYATDCSNVQHGTFRNKYQLRYQKKNKQYSGTS